MKRLLVATLASSLILGCSLFKPPSTVEVPADRTPGSTPPTMLVTPGKSVVQLDAAGQHQRLRWNDHLGSDERGTQALSDSIDMSATTLETSSSQPGTEVMIQNVPTTMGKVRVAILNPDDSVRTWAMLRDLGESKRIALMTPMILGDLRLRVHVRGAMGPVLVLHVEAPPAAPPDKDAAALVQAVASLAENDAIQTSNPTAIPLIIHMFLDHPINDNSLSALLSGTAPSQQGKELVDRTLVNGVLASQDTVDSIKRMQESLNRLANAHTAVTQTAAYKTQGLAESLGGLLAGQSSTEMERLRQAELDLYNNRIDGENALAAVIATMASGMRESRDFGELVYALASIQLGVLLKYQQAKAILPAAVELDTPVFDGSDGFGPTEFSLDSTLAESRTKHWSVTGRIVSRPMTLSGSALLEQLGLPESVLKRYCVYFYGMLTSPFNPVQKERMEIEAKNFVIRVHNGAISLTNAGISSWNENLGWVYRQQLLESVPYLEIPARVEQQLKAIQTLNDFLTTLVSNDNGNPSVTDLNFNPDTSQLTWGARKVWYEGDLTRYCRVQELRQSSPPGTAYPVSLTAGNGFTLGNVGEASFVMASCVPGLSIQDAKSATLHFRAITGTPVIAVVNGAPHRAGFKWANIDTANFLDDGSVPAGIAVRINDWQAHYVSRNACNYELSELAPGNYTIQVAVYSESIPGIKVLGRTQASASFRVTDWPTVTANTSSSEQVTLSWTDVDLVTPVSGKTPTDVIRILDGNESKPVAISTRPTGSFLENLLPGRHYVTLRAGVLDAAGGWLLGPDQTGVSFEVQLATGSLDLKIR